jgi:hypothetical protein
MNGLYILLLLIPFKLATLISIWHCVKHYSERERCMREINSEINSNLTRRSSVDTLPPYTQELEEIVVKDLPIYEEAQTAATNA